MDLFEHVGGWYATKVLELFHCENLHIKAVGDNLKCVILCSDVVHENFSRMHENHVLGKEEAQKEQCRNARMNFM